MDGAPEGRQRVHAARSGVDQGRVVVLPAGLVLLGAAVVVDGEQHRPALAGGGAEVDRRLAAPAADLDERPAGTAGGTASYSARPSSSGMKPLAARASAQQVGVHRGPLGYRPSTGEPSQG